MSLHEESLARFETTLIDLASAAWDCSPLIVGMDANVQVCADEGDDRIGEFALCHDTRRNTGRREVMLGSLPPDLIFCNTHFGDVVSNWTHRHFVSESLTQRDFVCVRGVRLDQVQDAWVSHELRANSDHFPVFAIIQVGVMVKGHRYKPIGWQCAQVGNFQQDLQAQLDEGDDSLEGFMGALVTSAARHTRPPRRQELTEEEIACREVERQLRVTSDALTRSSLSKELWALRARARRARHRARAQGARHQPGHPKLRPRHVLRALDGDADTAAWPAHLQGFFTEIYSDHLQTRAMWLRSFEVTYAEVLRTLPDSDEAMRDLCFVGAEVQSAAVLLRKQRTCSEDGIVAEMLQQLSDSQYELLARLFTDLARGRIAQPLAWKTLFTVLLPKMAKANRCRDLRPITILSVVHKLYLRLLFSRAAPKLLSSLHQFSFGFRPHYQSAELVFCLKMIVERCCEWRLDIAIAKLDLKKAFDSVTHPAIWATLTRHLPLHIAGAIMRQIVGATMTASIQGVVSGLVCLERGVRQGDPLSPTLFGCTVDRKLAVLQTSWSGRRLGFCLHQSDGSRFCLPILAFADDIYLLTSSPTMLQVMLREFANAMLDVGLSLCPDKCVWASTSRTAMGPVSVRGQVVPQLPRGESMTVLGSCMTLDGRTNAAVDHRLRLGWKAFFAIRHLFDPEAVTARKILQVLQSRVRTPAIYQLHLAFVSLADLRRIRSVQLGMVAGTLYRRRRPGEDYIAHFRRSRRQAAELCELHCGFWHQFVALQQLRWAGHVARMELERLAHIVLRWKDRAWWSARQADIRNGIPGLRHPGQFNSMRFWETRCVSFAEFACEATGLPANTSWHAFAQDREQFDRLAVEYSNSRVPRRL